MTRGGAATDTPAPDEAVGGLRKNEDLSVAP
jgi:hypothetical protein